MSYFSRLNRSFIDVPHLPLEPDSKYILFSDCHRGAGTANDNFLKNQNLYFAAMQHYYKHGYHYLELGDGDELWENRCMPQIMEIHSNTFWLLSKFHHQNRLHMIYGNHDIQKKNNHFIKDSCNTYNDSCQQHQVDLLPAITFYPGLILDNDQQNIHLYLTHGHQADLLNSTLWRLSRFLVRYIWKTMELFGFLDPTSAAKNNTHKQKTERRLTHWATVHDKTLITGHTHRPMLPTHGKLNYINTGSCVHPRCITGIEIEHMSLTLIKWTYATRPDMTLYVQREVLAGPIALVSQAPKG